MKDISLAENVTKIEKTGSNGHKVNLTANFIRIEVDDSKKICEYIVKFHPEVEFKAFRIKMLSDHFPRQSFHAATMVEIVYFCHIVFLKMYLSSTANFRVITRQPL